MTNPNKIDKAKVIAELSETWLAGLEAAERDEAMQLLTEVVNDWALEADQTPDPSTVLRFQLEDFNQKGEGQDAQGRLTVLRLHVLGRKVDHLSVQTYALGTAILDGAIDDEQGRIEGRVLLDQAEALGKEVKKMSPSPEIEQIRRDLGEAMMEALFAVERKAMSPRLDRR